MVEFNKLTIRGFIGTIGKDGTISRSVGKDNQGVQFVIGSGYDSPIPQKDVPKSMSGRRLSERKVDWFNCTSWDEDIVKAFQHDVFGKNEPVQAEGYIRFRKDGEGRIFTNVTITSMVSVADAPSHLEEMLAG
jgi:hypothetical protein